MTQIRVDEWLAELNRLAVEVNKEDGATVRELHDACGMPLAAIRSLIRKAIASGDWEHVKVLRVDMRGAAMKVPAYRPKAKKGKAK